MAGDPSPHSPGSSGGSPPNAGQGWAVLGYLMAGMAVWGFVGWLIDQWLGSGGIATAVGIVVGAAGGIYLVLKRLGPR